MKITQFVRASWWHWFPDGKSLIVFGSARDQSKISLCIPIDGSEAKPIGPGHLVFPCILYNDGQRVVAQGADDRLMIHPTFSGGEPTPLAGNERGDSPVCWSDDGTSIYVVQRGKPPMSIIRIDIASGERTVWQDIVPTDLTGVVDVFPVRLTPDGAHYAYSYRRCLSDLYLVK